MGVKWHNKELLLWFMAKFPQFQYRFEALFQKQIRLEQRVRPFVVDTYYNFFKLNHSKDAAFIEGSSEKIDTVLIRANNILNSLQQSGELPLSQLQNLLNLVLVSTECREIVNVIFKFCYPVLPKINSDSHILDQSLLCM